MTNPGPIRNILGVDPRPKGGLSLGNGQIHYKAWVTNEACFLKFIHFL